MKNLILVVILTFIAITTNAQWSYEVVDNGFDDKYKIAYTARNNNAILKLENFDGDLIFYLQGDYFCDDNPDVDLVFIVNGVSKKYSITGVKSEDNSSLFFQTNLTISNIYSDFKNCTHLKVRINEVYCDDEVYTFNMSKSTSACMYMLNK